MKNRFLQQLGVYGYESVEPIVLAALVTEDPLLLIGKAGTGKTYLLNSLSAALELEHRHYNASLISFDDLIGFPYPDDEGGHIRYLETPATVWQAESVLIDEISRCKPEHQNRLFSLVHERRIQGLPMPSLRYRWAAMNPCSSNGSDADFYEGSIALDQALADRFAFLVEVPDWQDLSEKDQRKIADPRGSLAVSESSGRLKKRISAARDTFDQLLLQLPKALPEYALTIASLLGSSGVRLSPRRVRQLTRNLVAITALNDGQLDEDAFALTLRASIPHLAWGQPPDEATLHSAHRAAWDAVFAQGCEKWLNGLLIESSLPRRVKKLLNEAPNPDTGTIAVTRTLATEPPERRALFAFALYPITLECSPAPIGREGINELGKICSRIVDIDAEIHWQERTLSGKTSHPQRTLFANALVRLRGKRRKRAEQLFYYFLVDEIAIDDPVSVEKEFNQCISTIRTWLRKQPAQ